jgi:hypothetical protein
VVLTNEPLILTDIIVDAPLANSDHASVCFCVLRPPPATHDKKQNVCLNYRWESADFVGLNAYLRAYYWTQILTTNFSADALWATFCNVLRTGIDKYVPKSYCLQNKKKNSRKYPTRICSAIARKRSLWKQRKLQPKNTLIGGVYRAQVQTCRRLVREYEISKEAAVIDADNVGKFYSFINRKLACSSGVGALIDPEGSVVTSDAEKAELLNNYFVSIGTVDDGACPHVTAAVSPGVSIESITFGASEILRELKALDPKGSAGPDGYAPGLLKKTIRIVSVAAVVVVQFIHVSRPGADSLEARDRCSYS